MAKQNTKTQISERQQYIQKLQQKVETRKKVSKIFIQVFAVIMVCGMLLSSVSTLLGTLGR